MNIEALLNLLDKVRLGEERPLTPGQFEGLGLLMHTLAQEGDGASVARLWVMCNRSCALAVGINPHAARLVSSLASDMNIPPGCEGAQESFLNWFRIDEDGE